jgi:L-threonylcarbamoyladenylate synthase
LEDLNGRIDAVLDGGPTLVGVESTVIGPSQDGEGWMLYRPGGVSLESLEWVLGADGVEVFRPVERAEAPESLPSPGVGIRHYAPRARLILVSEGSLIGAVSQASEEGTRIGVMLPDGWDVSAAERVYRWGPWSDGESLARRLFAGLRELDDAGVEVIVCPVPEMGGIGAAIRDRLRKAAREK